MNRNDLCFMRQGTCVAELKEEDCVLVQPVDKRGSGRDRALLALHGFSSSPAVFRYLFPLLKTYDAIVCPVLPGHAQSIEVFAQASAAAWLSAARTSCEGLLQEYRQVDVLGLSLGGLLACSLSQAYSLGHLFLLAPAFRLNWPVGVLVWGLKLLRRFGVKEMINAGGNLMCENRAEITYKKTSIAATIEILQLIQQVQWSPAPCPVDLFLGSKDKVIPSSKIAAMLSKQEGVRVHWLAHSAHVLPLDNDYEEIARVMNEVGS